MILLFLASLLAGGLNALAGGGSFISFPALLLMGVPPIQANATNNVALVPGMMASAYGYHEHLVREKGWLLLIILSFLGSFIGALLLLYTPPLTFMKLVPWLLLVATLIFTFEGFILSSKGVSRRNALVLQGLTAVYGGYFGAGVGIVILATLSLLGMKQIHLMNGLKSLLVMVINTVAASLFIGAHLVVWPEAVVMMLGSMIGGYSGARLAQKVDGRLIRGFVICTGFFLTIYFFLTA